MRVEASGRRTLAMDLGDPGFPAPGEALAAARRALEEAPPTYPYGDRDGLPELREAIARHRSARGDPTEADSVVVTTGASGGLAATILCTTAPGDEVLCPDPGYPLFEQLVQSFGRRLARYPALGPDGAPDAGLVAAHVTPSTRLVIWNQPSNPLGSVADAEANREVAELAAERGLAVLSDEAYEDLVLDGPALVPPRGPTVYSVHSFSKSFGLAGWRVGYVVAPKGRAAAVARSHWFVAMTVSWVGQRAALGALAAPAEYGARVRDDLRGGRDRALGALAAAGVPHCVPAAGMFAWLDVQATGLDDDGFARACARAAGVRLAPGSPFGPAGRQRVRLNFSGPIDDVADGAGRVARCYAALVESRR